MRVLLDTNVVLDALLGRPPWHATATSLLDASRRGRLSCAVTALSIANVFYIGRRIVGLPRAVRDVRTCLDTLEVLAVDRATLDAATALPGSDFEDNIQIAAAVRAGMDGIVTRDPLGFAGSPIRVLTPQQLLERLATDARQNE
jgi:predicted nucleic acid-binding protein